MGFEEPSKNPLIAPERVYSDLATLADELETPLNGGLALADLRGLVVLAAQNIPVDAPAMALADQIFSERYALFLHAATHDGEWPCANERWAL